MNHTTSNKSGNALSLQDAFVPTSVWLPVWSPISVCVGYTERHTHSISLSGRPHQRQRHLSAGVSSPGVENWNSECIFEESRQGHLIPPPRDTSVTTRPRLTTSLPRPNSNLRTKKYCSLINFGLHHYQPTQWLLTHSTHLCQHL